MYKLEYKRKPLYSGPGKTGICKCGHSWQRHHLGLVARQEYLDQTHEGYIPQECEYYGRNEMGGMMEDEEGNLVVHCFSYRDSGDKDA